MITVTADIIVSCIGFIAGFKADKAVRFYNVRGANFPRCLLDDNENERVVMELINEGMSCRDVASKLGFSNGTVTARIARSKSRTAFYYEYIAFYEFIEPVRVMHLTDVLDAVDKRFVEDCNNRGVFTVGELIDIYTHNTLAKAGDMTAMVRLDRKRRIFGAIADCCIDILRSVK